MGADGRRIVEQDDPSLESFKSFRIAMVGCLSTVMAVGTCINAGQGTLQKVQGLTGEVRVTGFGPAEQAAYSGRGGNKERQHVLAFAVDEGIGESGPAVIVAAGTSTRSKRRVACAYWRRVGPRVLGYDE